MTTKHKHKWGTWKLAKNGTWLSFPLCGCALLFRTKTPQQIARTLNAWERRPKYRRALRVEIQSEHDHGTPFLYVHNPRKGKP